MKYFRSVKFSKQLTIAIWTTAWRVAFRILPGIVRTRDHSYGFYSIHVPKRGSAESHNFVNAVKIDTTPLQFQPITARLCDT